MTSSPGGVRHLTALLHQDGSPFWSRQRECLRERGVDVQICLLVESFQADEDTELGVLLTRDRRVIEFELNYQKTGDPKDAVITRWDDLTEDWQRSAFDRAVEAGLVLFDNDNPG